MYKAFKNVYLYLQKGGKTKILFFIGQESGRPKQDDVTTMNLVLEAAPEIGQNYGVILPKISLKMARKLKNGWNTFLLGLFAGKFLGQIQIRQSFLLTNCNLSGR